MAGFGNSGADFGKCFSYPALERLMWKLAELHLLILVVVGHVVIADQVRDPRGRYRGAEHSGLGDQPHGQLASIADAFDAHALAIEPQIAAQSRTDTVEDVLRFVAVLISKYRICECLTIAG